MKLVNLDITALIALCSELTHGGCQKKFPDHLVLQRQVWPRPALRHDAGTTALTGGGGGVAISTEYVAVWMFVMGRNCKVNPDSV